MRKAWILAAMLALLVTPTWTQARERTTREGGDRAERRSAESRHPGAKSRATQKKSSKKKSSHKTKSDSHREQRSRDSRSASREHRRHNNDRRDTYRRPQKKDDRHRTSRAPRGQHDRARASSRSHREDRRHSYRRPPKRSPHHTYRHASKHHYRHGTFRRAPRYRCVRRSIHVYPSFLPTYRFGYYWSAGYYYPRYHYDYGSYPERAALRVQAEPKDAEVYVDGYYAGIVDDFDGTFQRLYVAPGTHEITLRLDGFETWSAAIYATPYSTLRVHHHMMPGPAGEAYIGTTSMEPSPDVYEY